MNTERILPAGDRQTSYYEVRPQHRKRKRRSTRPIEAVTFDRLDLSSEKPDDEYSWLTSMVTNMSDEQVSAKMKQFTETNVDIDDALVEKLLFEVL